MNRRINLALSARRPAAAMLFGLTALAALLAGLSGCMAPNDEATLRTHLAERMPGMPAIDEISHSAVAGLYELRIGNQIFYSDEDGNHLIQGTVFDTRTHTDLTRVRIEKLTAIDFKALPLKDAIVIRHGDGARKLAVFADPNCSYCKHFEQDLAALKDVTIYLFPLPILGADSQAKARDIWCASDAPQRWRAWMLEGATPPHADAACDASALDRNVALARTHLIQATPSLVFEDGSRNSGGLAADVVETRLRGAAAKS